MTLQNLYALLLALALLATGGSASFAQEGWPGETRRAPVPSGGHSGGAATSSGAPLDVEAADPDAATAPFVGPGSTGTVDGDMDGRGPPRIRPDAR
ncbi:hypothetical protein [Methylobacterium oxalidis]|uniref:hypothetical protein n=1 Tax=Methylobacterium oxalidis TaxID=944322 RepID=UPI0014788B3F|nr:hypothetical protein [Methylobacterium oxalidis]